MKRTISEDASQVAQDLRRSGRLASVQHVPNPYAVLSLAIGEQDSGAIRRAFLRAVRSYQPQTHPTEFVCIVEAYEMLRDPARRAAVESGLLEVPVAGGKHRRLGGLTPQTAAAFLRARDGPVCALDQHGLCHPSGHAPPRDAAAPGGGPRGFAAGSPQGPGPGQGSRDAAPTAECVAGGVGAWEAAGHCLPRVGDDMDMPLGEEALPRSESVGSAMNVEPLGRTVSVASAMSL